MKINIHTGIAGLFLGGAMLLSVAQANAEPLVVNGETISPSERFDAAKAEGKLNIFSTYDLAPMEAVVAAFKEDTGLEVTHMRLTSGQMFERVTSEFAANRLEADYVDLTDLSLVARLVEQKILEPYKVASFDDLPPELRAHDGSYYQLMRSIMVVSVNNALVEAADTPKSWQDLLDPKFKNVIGMASIDAGGTAFSSYAFMKEKLGGDYWEKLAAQSPRIYPTATPVMTDIVRGETFLGINPISLPLSQIENGAPITIVYPEEGLPAFPIVGGMTSSAKNKNAAQLFLDWLTSKRGGEVIASTAAYALNPQAPAPSFGESALPSNDQLFNVGEDIWLNQRQSYTEEWRSRFGTR